MIEIKEIRNTATKEEFINKDYLLCQYFGFLTAITERSRSYESDWIIYGAMLLAVMMGVIEEEQLDSFCEETFGINGKRGKEND